LLIIQLVGEEDTPFGLLDWHPSAHIQSLNVGNGRAKVKEFGVVGLAHGLLWLLSLLNLLNDDVLFCHDLNLILAVDSTESNSTIDLINHPLLTQIVED
jgi:hypothetical protein